MKKMKRFIHTILLTTLLILAGCSPLLQQPASESEPLAGGKVAVTLNFSAGNTRTILPDDTFDSYYIEFNNDEGLSHDRIGPITTNSPTVELDVGTWDITVYGMIDGSSAAEGIAEDVEVEAGMSAVAITLANTTVGSGTIDWSAVTLPATASGELTVIDISDGSPVGGTSYWGMDDYGTINWNDGSYPFGSDTFGAGIYLVTVSAITGSGSGNVANKSDIVIVSDNMTSYIDWQITEDAFGPAITISGTVDLSGLTGLQSASIVLKKGSVTVGTANIATPSGTQNWSITMPQLSAAVNLTGYVQFTFAGDYTTQKIFTVNGVKDEDITAPAQGPWTISAPAVMTLSSSITGFDVQSLAAPSDAYIEIYNNSIYATYYDSIYLNYSDGEFTVENGVVSWSKTIQQFATAEDVQVDFYYFDYVDSNGDTQSDFISDYTIPGVHNADKAYNLIFDTWDVGGTIINTEGLTLNSIEVADLNTMNPVSGSITTVDADNATWTAELPVMLVNGTSANIMTSLDIDGQGTPVMTSFADKTESQAKSLEIDATAALPTIGGTITGIPAGKTLDSANIYLYDALPIGGSGTPIGGGGTTSGNAWTAEVLPQAIGTTVWAEVELNYTDGETGDFYQSISSIANGGTGYTLTAPNYLKGTLDVTGDLVSASIYFFPDSSRTYQIGYISDSDTIKDDGNWAWQVPLASLTSVYAMVQYQDDNGSHMFTCTIDATSTSTIALPPPADIPENGITALTENTWADGELETKNDTNWYSFTAEQGTTYYFFENTQNSMSNTDKTMLIGNVYNVYNEAGESLGSLFPYSSSYSFEALADGTVYLEATSVELPPYGAPSGYGTGTYGLVFSTDDEMPVIPPSEEDFANAEPLTIDTWADGTIAGLVTEYWYKFTAEAANTYYILWADSYSNLVVEGKTADVKIEIYKEDGELHYAEDDQDGNEGCRIEDTALTGYAGNIYIKIIPLSPGDVGTFGVQYTTTLPTL